MNFFTTSQIKKLFDLAKPDPGLFDFPVVGEVLGDPDADFFAGSLHDARLLSMLCRVANPQLESVDPVPMIGAANPDMTSPLLGYRIAFLERDSK
jgi:hypothetical protein